MYLQRTIEQSKLSSEYQNGHSSTWFNSGEDQWIVEWLPNTVAVTSTTDSRLLKTYVSTYAYANSKVTLDAFDTPHEVNDP